MNNGGLQHPSFQGINSMSRFIGRITFSALNLGLYLDAP